MGCSRAVRHRRPRWALPAAGLLAAALGGCGPLRHQGDAGGTAMAVQVHLERGFVHGMHSRQWAEKARAEASYGGGYGGGHGGTPTATGIGVNLATTTVYLLGGDGPGQAQVFLHELHWGYNDFSVPLRPGRQLVLTVEAEGGREGAESLGRISVPSRGQPRLAVILTAAGAQVLVTPLPPAPPPPRATGRETAASRFYGEGEDDAQASPVSTTTNAHAVGLGTDQAAVAPPTGPVEIPVPPSAPAIPAPSGTTGTPGGHGTP
jgi:hypothetical protein